MLRDLWFRLRALFRRGTVERELDEELSFHLERSVDAHLRAGLGREEAERLARQELGGLDATKEDCRDARGVRPLDDLAQDLRYGVRVLARSPAFTAVAVLTLALGIGANTAMFSVIDSVLLEPMPYPQPGELVRLHGRYERYPQGSISYLNFRDWQAASRSFAAMAIERPLAFTLDRERIVGDLVTADYLSLLGIQPIVGRGFTAEDDGFGARPVAILGERMWRRKYGASPDVLGKTLVLDEKAYVVIGVVPSDVDLRLVSGGQAPDVYVPMAQWANPALQVRGAGLGIHGVGRLAPGVTVEQARADLDAVCRAMTKTHPDSNKNMGATVVPLRDSVVGSVRPYLLLLWAAVGLVLLIACVNVANLLLARAAVRARELGIRRALGATTGRLVRQLLTESFLLSLAGGALGLLLAAWGTQALVAAIPGSLPRAASVGVDGGVLAFTAAVVLTAGLLSGLAPALRAARVDLHGTLKEGGRGVTRHRMQVVFVVMQTAMALVLLVGAGLLVRTLARLWSVDPGFRSEGVVSFGVSLPASLAKDGAAPVRAAWRRVEDALAAVPGVESVALAAGGVPIETDDQMVFYPEGQTPPPGQDGMSLAMRFVVGPGYFETMGMRLARGRFFRGSDDERAPRVVIVDDVFAETYFPGADAVGKKVYIDDNGFEPAEIVGVVGHVKQWGLDRDETTAVRAQVYLPLRQWPDELIQRGGTAFFGLVRAKGDVVPALRAAVQGVGAETAMYRVRTLEEGIRTFQATRRFAMLVLAGFAALSLLLACLGIYGVVAYVVAQRTTEIGIRMALGAQASDILGLVLRQGLKLALAGVALGLGVAMGVTRFMGSLVYGVPPIDPVTFGAVACAVTIVALGATLLPARRAMRMDPMRALRED